MYFMNIIKVTEISSNSKLLKKLICLQSRARGIISRNKNRQFLKSGHNISGNYNQYKHVVSSNTRIVKLFQNLF